MKALQWIKDKGMKELSAIEDVDGLALDLFELGGHFHIGKAADGARVLAWLSQHGVTARHERRTVHMLRLTKAVPHKHHST